MYGQTGALSFFVSGAREKEGMRTQGEESERGTRGGGGGKRATFAILLASN
jgi:hypothetical protein